MRMHVNCACAIGTRLNLDLLRVAQNDVMLELAELQLAKTATLASLQTSRLKRDTTTKATSFCV